MTLLQPFVGHVVAAGSARAVVAPPYDALSPEQRSAMAAADPDSFLNALPASTAGSPDSLERTLRACHDSVERLIAVGRFAELPGPVMAIIAIDADGDRTIAVIGDLPASAFDGDGEAAGGVLPHEQVHPARVEQLARYLEVVGFASSPVAVAHRPDPEVARVTADIVDRPPRLGFRGEDGTDIAVWIVDAPQDQARLATAIDRAGQLYVTDGHHRAAAVRSYAAGRAAGPHDPSGRVLTAVIPSDRLRVLPFHRRLIGVPEPSVHAVLGRLRDRGIDPQELDGPWQPDLPGVVALTVEGRWWSIDLRDRRVAGAVESLDVRLAEREVIEPLLEQVAGAERQGAVEPVAAPTGLGALEGPGVVGVALPPPGIAAILEVADAREIMPPKTTYVVPKLRSGLFLSPR